MYQYVLAKNTNHGTFEQIVSSLKRLLLIKSAWSKRRTLSDMPNTHSREPQLKLAYPSLVICSIKIIWFKLRSKTSNRKLPIKFFGLLELEANYDSF